MKSVFQCWWNTYRSLLLLMGLFVLIFAISFSLYRLPWQVIAYPGLLCFFFAFLWMLWEFLSIRSRLKALENYVQDPQSETFPLLSKNPYYSKLHDLINSLLAQKRELLSRRDRQEKEQVDYYTLWLHQIKTPLSAMDLLLQHEDSLQSRQLQRLNHQIDQYVQLALAYIRIQAYENDFVFEPVDLDHILSELFSSFSLEFIERNLRLDFTETKKVLVSDEKWLALLIGQILSNALKYTPKGAVHVYWEQNALVIEDEGIGISQSDLKRIFEKGYTGVQGREDKKASGIGLWLSRRIAKDLGILLEIDSELKKGTKVKLDFSKILALSADGAERNR